MNILGIESSCDETGLALLKVEGDKYSVLANVLNSQIKIHKKTHGVVPEVAARRHVEVINPLLNKLLKKAKIKLNEIDLIGVTYGPGLIGSLIIGLEVARTIAYLTNKPIIPINHLKAHLQSNYFNEERGVIEQLSYPALGLLVSGGHTELVLINSSGDFKIIGETLDDAVGESFDKVARLLDLPYPGGPQIAKLAEKGDIKGYDLPVAMRKSHDLNFSYSGLKTQVRRLIKSKSKWSKKEMSNICASFQHAAVEQLVEKTLAAVKVHQVKLLMVAGGVSANRYLRQQLTERLPKEVELKIPPFYLCTDNALMIAMASYLEYRSNPQAVVSWENITVDPSVNI